MSDAQPPSTSDDPSFQAERTSVIFHGMVMQLANMAMLLMGKVPHPQTGQTTVDLDAARMFIDQLEMLTVKTKGNLDKHEDALLRHHLMTLRLAYVDAVNQTPSAASSATATKSPDQSASADSFTPPGDTTAGSDESRKKFTKKY